MSASHPLLAGDYYGPAIGALCFVFVMSRVPEPARRTFKPFLLPEPAEPIERGIRQMGTSIVIPK